MEFVLCLLFQRKLSSKKPPLTPIQSSFFFFFPRVYPLNSALNCWHSKHIALGLKALLVPTSQTFPRPFFLLCAPAAGPKDTHSASIPRQTFPLCALPVPWTSSRRIAGSALSLLVYFSCSTSFSGVHFMKTIL